MGTQLRKYCWQVRERHNGISSYLRSNKLLLSPLITYPSGFLHKIQMTGGHISGKLQTYFFHSEFTAKPYTVSTTFKGRVILAH